MIALGFAVALLLAGSGTAEAAGGGSKVRRQPSPWLVSFWGKAGLEIDPNGSAMTTPLPPAAPPPATPSSTGGGSTYRASHLPSPQGLGPAGALNRAPR